MKNVLAIIENRKWTPLEILLSMVCAFLGGVVVGFIFSPKGERSYGSYNGNLNGSNNGRA